MLKTTNTIQAVLFDLDGTLVETLGDFVAGLNGMAHALWPQLQVSTNTAPFGGFAPSLVRQWVGQGSDHLVGCALDYLGWTSARAGFADVRVAALASYLDHYQRHNGNASHVLPGAQACLQVLRARGLRLACVTNKPQRASETLLAHKALLPSFDLVLGGDRLPQKKPHPAPLLYAAQQLCASPAQTVMVGDSIYDAQAARAAGCPIVIVRGGYGEAPTQAGCDAIVNSLSDVPDLPLFG